MLLRPRASRSIGRPRVLAGLLSLALAAGLIGAVSPAGAELGPQPTNGWGVVGEIAGTETKTIKAEVFTIEQIGNRIFVGGKFTTATNGVVSEPQAGLAAFDATTGSFLSTWRPQLNGAVYALEASPDGSRLFVGGDFETYNGVTTGGLVAVDPATGAIDNSWTGRIGGYNVVRGLDTGPDGFLYATGGFTSISSAGQGSVAYRVGRFALSNGTIDSTWLPVIQGGTVWGIAASPDTNRVYLAGTFATSNGVFAQQGFAALSTIDGSNVAGLDPVAFNTTNTSRRYLYDVEVANGLVWVGGSEHFVQALNESDLSLEKFHLASPTGDFQDIEIVGDRVYAGCHCRLGARIDSSDGVLWYANQGPSAPITSTAPMAWVTAFDAFTGEHVDEFVATFNSTGPGVWAIHGSPDNCVWFGGDISSASNTAMNNLLRLCEDGGNPADLERPSVPGKPQITDVGPDSISATWIASTDNIGVTGYRIYDDATGTVLLDTPNTSGTITGLAAGTYQLYTKAYDAAGNESFRSGIQAVTVTGAVVDLERPSTPGKPQITDVGPDSISATWIASTDNIGVAGYRIYDDATDTVLLDTPNTSGTITGLAAGTYQLYTKAYDAAGNESFRSGIQAVTVTGAVVDLERPSTPTGNTVVSIVGSTVELAWNASTDNVGVTGYRLFDAANQPIVDVATTSATLTDLTPGTYGVYVKAFDAAGNLSWRSNTVTFVIP